MCSEYNRGNTCTNTVTNVQVHSVPLLESHPGIPHKHELLKSFYMIKSLKYSHLLNN